jgi:hypothetical protein
MEGLVMMLVGKFAVVFGGIVILLFAGAAKCDKTNSGEETQPASTASVSVNIGSTGQAIFCSPTRVPPDKPDLDGKRYITFYGCVEGKYAPIELNIFVSDETTGEKGSKNEPAAGNEVQYVIGYDTGHQVRYNAELKPTRPGSQQGFLYISDGKGSRHTYPINGGWKATSDDLYTVR